MTRGSCDNAEFRDIDVGDYRAISLHGFSRESPPARVTPAGTVSAQNRIEVLFIESRVLSFNR